ncbi:50S ribosomal protein L10 [Calderihabitans maritimus]|uniref:50S ribosomal protein L10 n=1 Tax=Calderihabitans maritimus TaxID=1246530 RepID=UPI001EE03EFA|nr:50S ribosomal protein L10 [Calderihabitans maritimus]
MKKKLDKEKVVQELKEKLSQSSAAVLTDYRGLNVAEMTDLRAKLREAGVEFKVVKNTLTWLAAKDVGLEELEPYLEGPTAIAFSYEDPVSPAKILSNFAKEHDNLEIKAGILEGKVIDLQKIKALADLPSREELLAKTVGGFQAPLYGLVNVLQGTIRNLVYVLEAIRQQKGA